MHEQPTISQDSPAWVAFTQISFVIALTAMTSGICVLPETIWIKGFLLMGLYFCVSATLTLSKTMRDNHEAKKLVNRISDAKTERILKEFELPR